MIKLLIVLGIVGLLIAGAVYFNQPEEAEEPRLYSGPVRPTDNETHFRLTGETIPLEVKE